LLARGRVSKQIAGQLAISEVTVRVHRSQILQKMGARSLADLVRMVDRLKADDENTSESVVAESPNDGLRRTSRTAKRAARKQKGRGNRAK
jgi:hypothetical protein